MAITRFSMIFMRLFPTDCQSMSKLLASSPNLLMHWLLSLMPFTKTNLTRDFMSSRLLPECLISPTSLVSTTWRPLDTKIILGGWEFTGPRDGTSFITCSSWRSSVEARTGLIDSWRSIPPFFTIGLLSYFTSFSHHLHTIYQNKLKNMHMKLTMDSLSKMLIFWKLCLHQKLPKSTMKRRLSCSMTFSRAGIQVLDDLWLEICMMFSSILEMTKQSISKPWLPPKMNYTWKKILHKWQMNSFKIWGRTMPSTWFSTLTTWSNRRGNWEKKVKKKDQSKRSKSKGMVQWFRSLEFQQN